MAPIDRFEDMEVWQSTRLLARTVYELSRDPGWARDFGLRDQIRRSAVSVMSNIAEGYECDSSTQFQRYLSYAKGSAGEVRAQLYVALDAGYLSQDSFAKASELALSCSRQLYGLMAYLRSHGQAHRVSECLAAYDAESQSQEPPLRNVPPE